MGMALRVVFLLLAGIGVATAADRRLYDFEVLLDGRPIGSHRYEVIATGAGSYQVDSQASFDLKVLGVSLYRYRHQAQERITENCLERIEAVTLDNGAQLAVRGTRSDGQFRLEAPAGQPGAGGCVTGYAYWDLQQLLSRRELLNPQTGQFDAVSIEYLGQESLLREAGSTPAHRYRLRSTGHVIDLWYSDDEEWLQLESSVRGGRQLRYRLRD
jgi:Family of unknown function (DUF6134)